jgi:hypothetical protein
MSVEAERRLEERIDRLERLLDAMADALMRKDTEPSPARPTRR